MAEGKSVVSQGSADGECRHFEVAIVGGGFAGTVMAAQMLRQSAGTVSVALIEKSPRIGRGVAYGTPCRQHLLNVPAKNMSAFPDDPEHFLRWARVHHLPGVQPCDFLPRQVYGEYVGFVLQQQIRLYPDRFRHMQDEAVSVERSAGTTKICLRSGQRLSANQVVLAPGNFPPGDPRLPGMTPRSQRYVPNPWAPGAMGDVLEAESVLLIGSGLTSVDVAMSLRAAGFAGKIHILSRRGLIPQTHRTSAAPPPIWDGEFPKTTGGLLRLVRAQVEAAQRRGGDWRTVIDSLRPFTQKIWRTLARAEQRRFLRHLRPYWEVHRHRVAPEIGAWLASQLLEGQIELHAGRITGYREDEGTVELTYRDRGSAEPRQLDVHRVFNCTGPEADCRRIENALLTNLMRQKMVRPDPLFLGLDTTEEGALMSASGEASEFLYALGPCRKGNLWETTAVPEIRRQAAELAAHLLAVYEGNDLVALEMAHTAAQINAM
jgi:uncharacterized NAD(P)/FAD-binding protein YdhS